MTEWPKHPDGSPLKFGEMTSDQKQEQLSKVGASDDSTPREDLLAAIRELQSEVTILKRNMHTIYHLCNAPYWTSERKRKIAEISRRK